ncbi:hypothetical protein PybrP1_000606 [[Pythium] brassicae (nom. inval.)]|nr:hypothetical protein PybrP1_000606 [[Pythium] brassicae (nom. inval.)]
MSHLIKAIASDHDLVQLAKILRIKLDGILLISEFGNERQTKKNASWLILLRGDGAATGHWVAALRDAEGLHWFDAYGIGPPESIKIKSYNQIQLQGASNEYCGHNITMTFYKPVQLDITVPQLKKAAQGKQITLSAKQLAGGGVKLHVHPTVHEKILKAKKLGKGTRVHLSPEAMMHTADMEGGSLGDTLKSIWSFVKKDLWPSIKPAVSGVLDAAVQPVATALGPYGVAAPAGRALIRNLTGVGMPGKVAKGSDAARARMAALRLRKKRRIVQN